MNPMTERLAAVRTRLGNDHLETTPTVVLIRLFDSRNKVVPYEHLLSVVEFSRSHGHTSDTRDIHGYCKHIRRAIRKYGWPLELKNHRSIGYQLLVTDPDWSLDPT